MSLSPLDRVRTNPSSRTRRRERISLLTEASRRAASYVANVPDRPVYPTPASVAALEHFRTAFPDGPREGRDVLGDLDRYGSPATAVVNDGRYFGFVTGGTDPAAGAAAVLAGAWDQNAGPKSPVSDVLDQVTCAWVVEALGLPRTAVASFNGGATVANLTGVITARDALYERLGWNVATRGLAGAPRLRVIVGDEVHLSAMKALRLAGFGEDQIERVPTDSDGAVRADAFPSDTDDHTLVLLQAGNVNTGASDPFAQIIPGVRERGGWVHVDGAFGLWAAASPTLKHLVAGVELADSWATDAHKWLSVPYDSGIVIVRDGADLARAMNAEAAYLPTDTTAQMNRGIQVSQRARAIETWAMLATHGRSGLADLIDRHCALARRCAAALRAGGATILAPVVLNQVLVQFGDEAQTAATIGAVEAEGTCWAGPTVWQGTRAMRISVSDAATTQDDIDASVEAMLRVWSGVRETSGQSVEQRAHHATEISLSRA
ncbi:pyridoxal-dependent decarboxylase [Demequina sp. B12]|uniref:pyridoxal phosphate-dependent decarboxylase family protein n=1 Tax=Demequina sp. B12 TaxID=2992757 RepID=UPI00237B1DCC|nr:pyridoxal-dependent decarboxylase [Demequina sp. B12]MDE0572551.1 pyridoxal-dependent decarboxylase [Demequina sp. B12]